MSVVALLCILLGLAVAVLLWRYLVQHRELNDVNEVSQQLQRIAIGGSLAGRLESGSSKPELSALITAINHLLTRVAAERDDGRVTPKLFAELGERIHEAVLVHRDVILYSNRQFAALVGADRVDLAGRRLGDLVPPEYAELVHENIRRRLAGEPAAERYEIEVLGRAGSGEPARDHLGARRLRRRQRASDDRRRDSSRRRPSRRCALKTERRIRQHICWR